MTTPDYAKFFVDVYQHGYVGYDSEGLQCCFYCGMLLLPSIDLVHSPDCLYVQLELIAKPLQDAMAHAARYQAKAARRAQDNAELTAIYQAALAYPKDSFMGRMWAKRYDAKGQEMMQWEKQNERAIDEENNATTS